MAIFLDASFGEKMSEAGINTVVGMGTVFAALILISLIISCFALISKIQRYVDEKKEKKALSKAPIEFDDNKTSNNELYEENEEYVDDTELVAVITAALMAYIGDEESSDGLTVRSIRKVNRKWKNA